MRNHFIYIALFLSILSTVGCENDDNSSSQPKRDVNLKQLQTDPWDNLIVDNPIPISDNHRQVLLLKATSAFDSSLDKGVSGSWKGIPHNLKGFCMLVNTPTQNHGHNNGINVWLMDTTVVNGSAIKVFGFRLFYSAAKTANAAYTGKKYLYSPYSDVHVLFSEYDSDSLTGTTENPNGPPDFRPYKDFDECYENRIAYMGRYVANVAFREKRAWMWCVWQLFWGEEARDVSGNIIPEGIPSNY